MKVAIGYIGILVLVFCFTKTTNSEQARTYSYESKPQQKLCCIGGIVLSPWAHSHYKDVRAVANIMRQQYFAISQGNNQGINIYAVPTFGDISKEELSSLIQQRVEYILNDIRTGRVAQNAVQQTNFFEQEAATLLESIEERHITNQHQIDINENTNVDQVETLNNFNNFQHITYPTEMHTIEDKTYVLKKNCTTTTSNMIPITVLSTNERRNESFSSSNINNNMQVNPILGHTSQYHNIYNYLNRQEGRVPSWTPQVIINEHTSNQHSMLNKPAVVIPVPPSIMDVETFNQHHNHHQNFQPTYYHSMPNGHSTVTIKQFNKTVITGSDGRPIVHGAETETFIKDGQVIYNTHTNLGTHEEEWKKHEREILFWLFQNKVITNEELETWQYQQEDRLQDLAYRFNTTVEAIEEWQRKEIERMNTLLYTQSMVTDNLEEWQKKEKVRLNWLIQQNSLNKIELENWQRRNENMLINLAHEYRISINQLKEWQKQQFEQLNQTINFQNNQLDTLKLWQNQEKDRLYSIIRQHNLTVEELQEQIRKDQTRLNNISQQYHVNIAEMEQWLKSELSRLTAIINQQQEEIKRLTEWQKQERFRLEEITRQHNLTVEDLTQQLHHDRNYLNNLAHKYQISIEELEAWQKKEIDRLRNIGTIRIETELKEWQQRERDRLMVIAQQNDFTIEEFEKKIKEDRNKLQMLAQQYQVRVEEIEEWIKKESNRLQSAGILKNVEEELNEWQKRERDRLLMIIRQNELNVEELQTKIKNDNQHLHNMALQYQVQVKEIEEWLKKEIERLKNQGIIKIENLEEWQKIERERLNQFILQNQFTIEEFEQSVLKDKDRLRNLAHIYQVKIEEIENFIRNEIHRIKTENSQNYQQLQDWQIEERKRLEQLVLENHLTLEQLKAMTLQDKYLLQNLAMQYHTNLQEIEEFIYSEIKRLQNMGTITITEEYTKIEKQNNWQRELHQHILSIVNDHYMSIHELQEKLKNDRYRLEKLAFDFHITVEEIEEWINQYIKHLLNQNLIYQSENLVDWQMKEHEYIQKLIAQRVLSFEELEYKLKHDQQRLRDLELQYRITIEELFDWYDKELNNLLVNGKIYHDNVIQWQQVEKDRIYAIVTGHILTLQELKQILWENAENLSALAQKYQIRVTELRKFQETVLQQLLSQGLIVYSDNQEAQTVDWQSAERERLNFIVTEFKISEYELSEFLKEDHEFHTNLTKKYGISLETLEDWHLQELRRLQSEGKLDNTQLLHVEYWQIRERNRLYLHILSGQLTKNDLLEWQKNLQNLQVIADSYHIHVEELRKWQLKEFERLQALAQYYRMSLRELAEFRQSELYRLSFVAHRFSVSNEEYLEWLQQEHKRLTLLSERYKLSLYALENWRRTLFLLCQGLIRFDFGDHQGQIIDNSYNVTAKHNVTIDSNRGDQPPNVIIEDYEDEPNIYGIRPTSGPIQEREPTTPQPQYHYPPMRPLAPIQVAPIPTSGGHVSTDTYGRTYRKKVTTYTVPVVLNENTENTYSYNAHHPAIPNKYQDASYHKRNTENLDDDVQKWNVEDSNQMIQKENLSEFDLKNSNEDEHQKLMQNEYNQMYEQQLLQQDLQDFSAAHHNDLENKNANLKEIENKEIKEANKDLLVQGDQIVEEQPSSFWGKFKKKTKDIFG